MPEWRLNKKARVLYAVGEAKGRRMNESYKDRYDKAYLYWRDLNESQKANVG